MIKICRICGMEDTDPYRAGDYLLELPGEYECNECYQFINNPNYPNSDGARKLLRKAYFKLAKRR